MCVCVSGVCVCVDELNAAIPKAGTHAAVISRSQVRGGEGRVCVCVCTWLLMEAL